MKTVEINNRKARFNYYIDKTYECGIVLKGTEIKSIREGSANFNDAYVTIKGNELYLVNMFIAKYKNGTIYNHEETRDRKLLMHKSEIRKLGEALREKGISIVPTRAYFKGGKVKIEIALVRGKKLYDKRKTIKERDLERSLRY